MTDAFFMNLAIEKAKEGIRNGQTPFGAAVVKDNAVVVAAHNSVWRDGDPSAHAEVNAIRLAAKILGTIELVGCTMYTTCEPCPMCLAAIHWSKMERTVYGAEIADAAACGFQELFVPASEMVRIGKSPLRLEFPVMREECRELFALWKSTAKSKTY